MNHFRVVLVNSQGKTLGVSGRPLDLVDASAARQSLAEQGFHAYLAVESRPLRQLAQCPEAAFTVALTLETM